MRSWWLASVLAMASCGRYAFDEHTDGGPDGDAFDPGLFTPIALPPGGKAKRVSIGPAGDLIVTLGPHGAVHSSDGVTWTECGPLSFGRATAIDAAGAQYVADDAHEVFASKDGCAHWAPTGLGVYAHEVATTGTTLYAATDTGLRAYDGASWRVIASPFEGTPITGLAVQGSLVLIGSAVGAARSTDAGQTWTMANTGLMNLHVDEIAIARSNPLRVYAVESSAGPSTGNLFRSDDGGMSWAALYANGGYNIAVDPTDPDHVLFANYNTLLGATDGSNYVDVRSPEMESSIPYGVAFDAAGGSWAATSRGIFYRQGNAPFAAKQTGLSAWVITDAATTATSDAVYFATPAGLLYSQDGGTTYALASNIGLSAGVQTVVVPAQPASNVLAASRFIGLSTNRGTAFNDLVDVGAPNGFLVSDLVSLSNGRVVAGTSTQTLHSDPPWTAWAAVPVDANMNGCFNLTVIAGDEIVAGCADGLMHSTDQGVSYQPMTAPPMGPKPITGPNGTLLGATADGLWAYAAGTWQRRGLDGIEVLDVLVQRATWVAATAPGVFVSHDDGVTWTRLAGLVGVRPTCLARDVDGNLLVGTDGFGLYRAPFP